MEIHDLPVAGYERVVRARDPESGLHALVAIHDTTLGPSLGGMRMWPYASESEAMTDVLRLARGMTFKSAVAHTGLGGGKSVVIGDPKAVKSEKLFLAMGRVVDSLGGRYITAEDVNIGIDDLEIVRRSTRWVSGLAREDGGSGNPSPYTAYGVYLGIRAACGRQFDNDELRSRHVAVQGVGAVGSALVERLVKAGARVTVADAREDRVRALAEKLGVATARVDEIVAVPCDVFAPCALGAVIDDRTIGTLRCKVIAGAANNVLHEPRHGRQLFERGVLYAPDYVINAGGIINVSAEFAAGGYVEAEALRRIERIPEALRQVWSISNDEKIPASDAADRLAMNIVAEAKARPAATKAATASPRPGHFAG
ncbi:MAG: Glu/Leu/Phe/Val dehydrogenase [Planctomycetes bacterium]|nr:Glu/Leu/Phe/Val dehydrogenase [Planctomycetota bacterium]